MPESKSGQKVSYWLNRHNHATYRNQTVTNIRLDSDHVLRADWNGHEVAAFCLDANEWFLV